MNEGISNISNYNQEELLRAIVKIRKQKGISQDKIAEDLKINKMSYYRYEKGDVKLTIERFFEICNILNVDPLDLMIPEAYGGFSERKLSRTGNSVIDNIVLERNALQNQVTEFKELFQLLRNLDISLVEYFGNSQKTTLLNNNSDFYDSLIDDLENEKEMFFTRLDNDYRLRKLFEFGVFNNGARHSNWLEYCELKRKGLR